MTGISRRTFGLAAGFGAIGAGGLGGGCSTRSGPTPTPEPASRGVGVVLSHEQFRTDRLVAHAQAAEQAGFRYVWASDHLQPWQDNEGHSMFPWLTLALVGNSTSSILFGTGVTCPIYRYHPATVAQAFASLAILNPGRVFLGLGTGERLNEQAATDTFGNYRERHDRLIEAIVLIRQLWSGERISFTGHYFRTDELKLYDTPAMPPPIFVAASGPRAPPWPADTVMVGSPKPATSTTPSCSPRSPRALKRPDEIPPPWVSGPNCSPSSATTRRPPAPPTCGDSPPGPSTSPIRSRSSVPPSRTRSRKCWPIGRSVPIPASTSVRCKRFSTPAPSPSCISPGRPDHRHRLLPHQRPARTALKPLDRTYDGLALSTMPVRRRAGERLPTVWDFETDPQYQSKLDWVEKFMAEELEPLDLVALDPYDKRTPTRWRSCGRCSGR